MAVAATALASWALDRVEVVGSSMAPTFQPGDRLLLVRRFRSLRVGDLVALTDPSFLDRRLVKRVRSIDAGAAIVVGDNEAASTDSRSFGAVPCDAIRHLVLRRYARASEP
jgi:nickel-type superoxide dismutase maturation protease